MGCSRNGSDKSPRSNKLLDIRLLYFLLRGVCFHSCRPGSMNRHIIILLYLGKFGVIICSDRVMKSLTL